MDTHNPPNHLSSSIGTGSSSAIGSPGGVGGVGGGGSDMETRIAAEQQRMQLMTAVSFNKRICESGIDDSVLTISGEFSLNRD